MTVIIGYETNSGCWLGADRRTVLHEDKFVDETTKLFNLCEGVWVGAAGLAGTKQGMVSRMSKPAAPKGNPQAWIERELVPRMKKSNMFEYDPHFILSVRGRLFCMCQGGSVVQIKGFYAIGSGGDMANGALSAMTSGSPRERVRRAVEICCERLTGCGGVPQLEFCAR